jgi:hypothetical protein
MRFIILSSLVILLFSCKSEQPASFDDDEYMKLEDVAIDIANHYTYNEPDSIVNLFNHRKFARRLGTDFYKLAKQEQTAVIGMVLFSLENSVVNTMQQMDQNNLVLNLIHIDQQEKTSRLFYLLTDQAGERLYDYLVYYIQKNEEDNTYNIVNQYHVSRAFSLGQSIKQVIKKQARDPNYFKKSYTITDRLETASGFEEIGEHRMAYDMVNQIRGSYSKLPNIAVYRSTLASHISKELYLEELNNLSAITPNEQSKMFYDCMKLSMDSTIVQEEKIDCFKQLQERLIE